jgi:hypothetical protein
VDLFSAPVLYADPVPLCVLIPTNGELALVAKNGGPLLFVDPDKERDRGVRWCQIENDLFALRKRLKLTAISFSNFRDTSSTFIDGVDRGLTDLFDGHKDNRMARFYVDGSKIDYNRMFSRLDSVLGELETFYALKYPSTAPLPQCPPQAAIDLV